MVLSIKMNKMKKLKFYFLALSLGIISCSDPCDDVDCGPNGTCIEGSCDCSVGYEGQFCDTEVRAKYFGTYSGDFSSCIPDLIDPNMLPPEISMINVLVGPDPSDINNVTITLANSFLPAENIVADPTGGVFIIPTTSQSIEIPDVPLPITITVSGSGEFLDENSFTINFNIIIPFVQPISCTITMTKI